MIPLVRIRDFFEEVIPKVPGVIFDLRESEREIVLWMQDESGERWCAVGAQRRSSWYSLQVEGFYSLDVVDEGATEEEVREDLCRLLNIGIAYLQGAAVIKKTRILKIPQMIVDLGDEKVYINPLIDELFKMFFRAKK